MPSWLSFLLCDLGVVPCDFQSAISTFAVVLCDLNSVMFAQCSMMFDMSHCPPSVRSTGSRERYARQLFIITTLEDLSLDHSAWSAKYAPSSELHDNTYTTPGLAFQSNGSSYQPRSRICRGWQNEHAYLSHRLLPTTAFFWDHH